MSQFRKRSPQGAVANDLVLQPVAFAEQLRDSADGELDPLFLDDAGDRQQANGTVDRLLAGAEGELLQIDSTLQPSQQRWGTSQVAQAAIREVRVHRDEVDFLEQGLVRLCSLTPRPR